MESNGEWRVESGEWGVGRIGDGDMERGDGEGRGARWVVRKVEKLG